MPVDTFVETSNTLQSETNGCHGMDVVDEARTESEVPLSAWRRVGDMPTSDGCVNLVVSTKSYSLLPCNADQVGGLL